MKAFIYLFIFIVSTFLGQAQQYTKEKLNTKIEGTWNGKIEIPAQNLSFVLHITNENNQLKATFDSPDQGGFNIEIPEIRFENKTLYLKHPKMMMTYEGQLTNRQNIQGTFTQGGQSFSLNLIKGEFKRNRLQDPKPPFDYKSEDITFGNKEAGIKLTGTLTTPSGKGKFPAVVLVSGSGPNNRDEEVFDHKPFLVIADYLTKNGYAVLRYDKRGIATSEGDFAKATVFDFANDTKAAIAYLKGRNEIDSKKIGILGHSEGGQVAQIIAAEDSSLNFIILMASPGIKGSELMVLQNDALSKAMEIPEFTRTLNKELNKKTYEIIMRNDSKEKADEELKEYFKTTVYFKDLSNKELDKQIKGLYTDHFRQLLLFNPMDYLPKINCKVLAINGTKDLQVTSAENLAGINKGLKIKENLKIISYEGLNHLFQTAKIGLPDEYGSIDITIEPKVLEDIKTWLNEKVK